MNETSQLSKQVWRHPLHLLAFGFGAGLSPVAPGTAGTLVAVPLYLALQYISLAPYLLIVMLGAVLGVWLCHITARNLRIHDHPGIVWDEIVGFLLAMSGAPHGWQWLLLGFSLFRLFDIWKPWPIRWADRHVGGGLGIMLDDIIAGIYACALLNVVAVFFSA